MRRPLVTWGAAIGALIAYDLHCDRNAVEGDTLSEVVREVFAVETPAGRAAFCLAWSVLGAWFVPHIIDKARAST